MVTLRTYWSPAQAALAKTLLDNYEVPCALLDENASLYNRGAQFAVPIRLVVDEAEIDRASLLLNGDFERADEIKSIKEVPIAEVIQPEAANRNPWELLVLAFYLLIPALCLIVTKFPKNLPGRWAEYFIARTIIAHFLSWVAVLFGAVLITLYFLVRRSTRQSTTTE